jgi:molybdopterin-containing oxidoreductase family membrane subunit
MWMERAMIVVTSLHRDYLPSAWGMFIPTAWDWITLAGSIALFVWLFLLFVRFLPLISMTEMRELVRDSAREGT